MEITRIHVRAFVALLVSSACLAACGGGSTAVMPVPFTSFSAIKSGQPVQANGISQTVSATTLGGTVQSTTVNAVDTASSSATLTYTALPAMSAFSFSTPKSSVNFSGMNVLCTTGVCQSSGTNTVAVVMNPLSAQSSTATWNYQSFGYWLVTSTGSSVAGAMSFGSPSVVAAIPATGSATYKGLSGGIYVDPTGAVFVQSSNMTSVANFGAPGVVTFSTSGTTIAPVGNTSATISASALDIVGSPLTITIIGTTQQFTGPVSTAGGTVGGVVTPIMSGTAQGQFYGPAVGPAPAPAEIGGIYSLKGTGPQTMLGGFGGKQQ